MAFGRRLVAAVVCVPLLLVGGCADDPEPKLAPPDDTPNSASSSPSASPTREPWEAKTNAGAVAFAKHWIDVFNEAQRTGDTSTMRELSARSCGTCQSFADMVDALYQAGGRIESKGWSITQAAPARGLPADEARVSLRVVRSAQVIHHGDGQPKEQFEESQVTLSARSVWRDASWVMNDLVALE